LGVYLFSFRDIPVPGMASVGYRSTDVGEIGLIRELWTELNVYHQDRAGVFQEVYAHRNFDTRKEYFETLAATGLLRLILAFDQ
jgi:hypothetical protein